MATSAPPTISRTYPFWLHSISNLTNSLLIPDGMYIFHNLPLNTNHIIWCHLEVSYQFVMSYRHSPGINLRLFSFNFPSISSTLPISQPVWWYFSKTLIWRPLYYVSTYLTFTLFCSRKTSVIVKIFLISFYVFVCAFLLEISIFGKSFPFPFPYFVLSILWYFPFHVVYSSWRLMII